MRLSSSSLFNRHGYIPCVVIGALDHVVTEFCNDGRVGFSDTLTALHHKCEDAGSCVVKVQHVTAAPLSVHRLGCIVGTHVPRYTPLLLVCNDILAQRAISHSV